MILDDEQFFSYWQQNGQKEKSSKKAFMLGLSSGFAIGVCVIAVIYSGWFQRATMVANSKMSTLVLFIALVGIAVFIAIIYRRFRWEMQDQRYHEILARKNKNNHPVQL